MAAKPAPKPRYVPSGEALRTRNAYDRQRRQDQARNTQPTVIYPAKDLVKRGTK